MFTDLRSDSYPWKIGNNPLDVPAPIGLLECHGTRGVGKGSARLCTKMTKVSVFTSNSRNPRERFVKAPLVQCTV